MKLIRILIILFISCALICPITSSAAPEKMQPIEMVSVAMNSYGPTHPAMVSDIMAVASPIRYRFRVDKGAKCELVMGFVERYWLEPGKRVMDVDAEGGPFTVIDAIASVGYRKPYLVAINCADANDDGWLTVEVRQLPGVVDPNPMLNALWLFDRDYWVERGLKAADVQSKAYDSYALYMVDCGVPGSEFVVRDCLDDLQKTKQSLQALAEISESNTAINEKFGAQIADLHTALKSIGQDEVIAVVSLNGLTDKLKSDIRETILSAYSPAYDKPVESRIFSPWGGMTRVRHDEDIKININSSPDAASLDYRNHSPAAWRSFPNWIEFVPETSVSDLSSRLGYGIDLDLKGVKYDPMKITYTYGSGSIDIQLHKGPSLGVYGNGVRFTVRFDKENMKKDGRLWYYDVKLMNGSETKDQPFFLGVIMDSGKSNVTETHVEASAKNAAIVWGRSLKELKAAASKASKWSSTRKEADKWAKDITSSLTLTGRDPYPAMMDLNRRAMTSMQYLAGPMFAALDGYTTIWVRDTTSAVVHAALGGDPVYLKKWAPYLFNNPSHESLDGKDYSIFWAFPTLNVEKQQDGQFYAARTAYTYWKLTGDASKLKDWYAVLKSAMEYQRKVYYSNDLGLYCEININEAALKEAGEWAIGEQFPDLKINGIWPVRSFDLYINNLMYATHMMMAEIAKEIGDNRDYVTNLRLARELADSIQKNLWDEKTGHYKCGLALLEDGRMVEFDWNYWDSFFDYVWAATLHPMLPDPEKMLISINAMMEQRKGQMPGNIYFAPSFPHESYLYSAAGYTDVAEKYLDLITEPSRKSAWNDDMGAYYVMDDSIIENLHAPQLHRPQVFTIGPWMHAVTARCAYIDCNGITVVPGGMITSAKGIRFRNAVLDVDTTGVKQVGGIIIDGKPLPGTLRIPIDMLTPGKHTVRLLEASSQPDILLAHTDYELRGMKVDADSVTYMLYGYGCGVVRIEGSFTKAEVTDECDKPMQFRQWSGRGGTRIQPDASGLFKVKVYK
ncbi:MAG: MGH1-like glycoside hydrolase domain-containing protein [Armatimonadota bacterium]